MTPQDRQFFEDLLHRLRQEIRQSVAAELRVSQFDVPPANPLLLSQELDQQVALLEHALDDVQEQIETSQCSTPCNEADFLGGEWEEPDCTPVRSGVDKPAFRPRGRTQDVERRGSVRSAPRRGWLGVAAGTAMSIGMAGGVMGAPDAEFDWERRQPSSGVRASTADQFGRHAADAGSGRLNFGSPGDYDGGLDE